MMKLFCASLLAALLAAPAALHADTYNYLITASPANGDPAYVLTASGTMSGPADPFNSAAVDVTSITGSANGYNFLGVVDPGATNSRTTATEFGFTFDNVLFPSSSTAHTDANGFLLYLDSPLGTSLAHVYYTGVTPENPGGYEVDVVDPNEPGASTPFGVANQFAVHRFNITQATPAAATPEPASLFLMATGFIALAGLTVRRFRKQPSPEISPRT
ncbi:MAG TPA: PEP-CTERM sorting domain-containing protein [Edaphobacter sp.]|nr:PEP-CTERM sorting domain-containing protein [Edaphobacter sp.]